ncbi:MAG: response regulator, partial [Cyclobacteriaceae bacterium]|nr:response regulator [Cyclobacteriaceae bacterium]
KFEHFRHDPENQESISNDLVNIFFIDSKGHYWVGTQGGINRFYPDKGSFKSYTVNDGFVDNVVKGILEDDDGLLWISTQNGLSKFDPEKGSFRNFHKKDGLQADVFTLSSCYKNSRGEMMFGGVNGVSIFNVDKIKELIITPPVQIDRIRINNIELSAGYKLNGRVLIDKSISKMEEIRLDHDENVITLEFTAIEYSSPDMLEFSYQLDGVDKQWNYAAFNERQVTYSGLRAGEYLFRLRATNKIGTWGQLERQLKIIVYPPFWATNLAILVYILIFAGIAFIIYYNVRNRITIKRELKKEKEAHQRQMEIEEFKLRFFTNISHDIKTPLTLISVPLQRLMKETNTISNTQRKHYFSTMHKSVQMLLKLVNQLLDFRKIENNKLKLEVNENDLVPYLKDLASSFIDYAEEKNLHFNIEIPEDKKMLWFDPKIIDKVFFNLLSNAFKFTPVGGSVTVQLLENQQGLNFSDSHAKKNLKYTGFLVKDTGIGIPEDKMDAIFKRFEKLKSGKEMGVGTGIGLAIVKRLVDIHRGYIEVDSKPGSGSSFKIWIPIDKSAYDESEIIDASEINTVPVNTETISTHENILIKDTSTQSTPNEITESSKSVNILVVEDYSEMRAFIKDILKNNYHITEAENGKKGYEKALLEGPDLIITDIMMPEMSGLELCKKIKKNVNVSHIPVVMLTARNTDENEIEGLETGANYFIKKPFNVDQLKLVVRNILEYRKKIQLRFSGNKIPEPKEVTVTSADEKFLINAVSILEENISNSEFTVEDLAKQTGLSPVHLYRKFKFLAGMSSNDFIKTFRMKRAAQLLRLNKMRISEVAYAVGFNDPRYFR